MVYDKKNEVLSIMASYVVDEYYINVYDTAKQSIQGDLSLTDIYIDKIRSYIICIKTYIECYKYVIKELYGSFLKTPRFRTLTFPGFIDKIVSQFIPNEYFTVLSAEQKDEMLSSIICDLFSTMGSVVTSPDILRKIIDQHDTDKRYINTIMYQEALNILNTKREVICSKIISKSGQSKEFISAEVSAEMRKQLDRTIDDNVKLKREILSLNSAIKELENKIEKYEFLVRLLYKKSFIDVKKLPDLPRNLQDNILTDNQNTTSIHQNTTIPSVDRVRRLPPEITHNTYDLSSLRSVSHSHDPMAMSNNLQEDDQLDKMSGNIFNRGASSSSSGMLHASDDNIQDVVIDMVNRQVIDSIQYDNNKPYNQSERMASVYREDDDEYDINL